MQDKYRGFVCAGSLGCFLVLLATPLLAQKPVNKNTTSTTTTTTATAAATDQCAGRVCGMLKVCKVAGYGVPPGTAFQFTDGSSAPPATIDAGLAPGNCKAELVPQGTVNIKEIPFGGYTVSNIDVVPAANIAVPPNLPAGTVSVKIINNEVTEVTYTNHSQKAGGYLEICKTVENNTIPLPGGYTFAVPGVSGLVTVKAGYCSPPLEVPVGTWTITETAVSGIKLVSCSVFPSGTCGHVAGTWTVTVTVPSSVLSQQTVVTIIDGPK
jgi:hypothetical protein